MSNATLVGMAIALIIALFMLMSCGAEAATARANHGPYVWEGGSHDHAYNHRNPRHRAELRGLEQDLARARAKLQADIASGHGRNRHNANLQVIADIERAIRDFRSGRR